MHPPTEEELRTEPFCSKGCKHVYEHTKKCGSEYLCPEPDKYEGMDNEDLLEVYDDLHADYARYSHPPIDWTSRLREYHRPTWEEASRRMGLVRDELLKRMGG